MFPAGAAEIPSLIWIGPFVALLLCIAILPLLERTAHWWHRNRNKLLVSVVLGLVTLAYYHQRGYGFVHRDATSAPGTATVVKVLGHAVLDEYIPFMSLLFSLYVIAGGICIRGDIPAHPLTNAGFLAAGGVLASLIGTTGASMLLIRPLLATNSERRHVVHTYVFFIFIVSNIGGCLLPIGDPPLFLGYLRGVPFLWTLVLWKEWALCMAIMLVIYYVWDTFAHRRETPGRIQLDETRVERLSIRGQINFVWLLCVVAATGMIDPSKPVPGTPWYPPMYLREALQTGFAVLSVLHTPRQIRELNEFNYAAILEVACLFLGIFVCMQVPIEILHARGPALGLTEPWHFFWATGMLSSFLDNAPTYVVFFEAAKSMTPNSTPASATILALLDGSRIQVDRLVAISLGAVFMGANTYIGNGPNFMVKSIVEHAGVKMPSFFGFMGYSGAILLPVLLLITYLFLL